MTSAYGAESTPQSIDAFFSGTAGFLIGQLTVKGTVASSKHRIVGADYKVKDPETCQPRTLQIDRVALPALYSVRIRNEHDVPIGSDIVTGSGLLDDPFQQVEYVLQLMEDAVQIGPCALRIATS